MTTRFIEKLRDSIALFICGEFALTAGARVARHPGEYGIRETWHVAGDAFFYHTLLRGSGPLEDPGRPGKDRRRRRQTRPVLVAAPLSLGRFALHSAHPALVRSVWRGYLPATLRRRGGNPPSHSPARGVFPGGTIWSRSDSALGSTKRRSGGYW